MKKKLLDILACPVCKGKLELMVREEKNLEVIRGTLLCYCCQVSYPIENGIPNLLPPVAPENETEK